MNDENECENEFVEEKPEFNDVFSAFAVHFIF